MRLRNRQFWSSFWILALAIGVFVTWFLGNLFYTLLWSLLGEWNVPVTEAKMIAYIGAHLIPFAGTLLLAAILAALIRHQMASVVVSASNREAIPASRLIEGMPLAISTIGNAVWIGQYAGFVTPREHDLQVISFEEVTISNTSAVRKLCLDVTLIISEQNVVLFEKLADLRGPGGFIYGRDDDNSKTLTAKGFPMQAYFHCPINLGPHEAQRKVLAFLFDEMPRPEQRAILNKVMDSWPTQKAYKFELEFKDVISNQSVRIELPGDYRA